VVIASECVLESDLWDDFYYLKLATNIIALKNPNELFLFNFRMVFETVNFLLMIIRNDLSNNLETINFSLKLIVN
jgi:hypothetical protein